MALVKLPSDGDWPALRQCLMKLATIRLGPDSSPTFESIAVDSNVTVSTFDAASAVIDAGVISSFVTTSAKADYALVTSMVCMSASISAGSFVSAFATKATITTLVCVSASISAGSFVSAFATKATITTLATVSASISALAVVSGFFDSALITSLTAKSAVISSIVAISIFADKATITALACATAVISSLTVSSAVSVAEIVITDGGIVGQAAGPLLTFDDTLNYLEITGCNVGIGTATPACGLHIYKDASAGVPYSQMYIEPTGANKGASLGLIATYLGTSRLWYFGVGDGGAPNTNNFRIVDVGVGGAGPIVDRINIDITGKVFVPGTLVVGTPPTYTVTNVTTDRAYNADSTGTNELADVLGTLIADLRAIGLVL